VHLKPKQRAASPWSAMALLFAATIHSNTAASQDLVDVATLAPTIVQDLRYATADNFLGRIVPGYQPGHTCRLERRTATALAAVQNDLAARGLSLKVYDCHRPQVAVDAFAQWAELAPAANDQTRFFPRLAKSSLHARGFISYRSGHTSGTAVDVGLLLRGAATASAFDPTRRYGDCTGPQADRAPDNALDLGTGYDCFDEASRALAQHLSPAQRRAQMTLRAAMIARGFRPYDREWWHFTFVAR
jgi:zinc D-Ala-D-Ala dipeptidase